MTLHSDIPEDMLDDFTMKGQISLRYDVKDDRTPKVCESVELILEMMQRGVEIESNYPMHDGVLKALLKDVKGKWLVVGSARPYYEALLLSKGCEVDVWEIKRKESSVKGLRYIQKEDLEKRVYDGVLAISSLEHFGLGRYGDPLDPWGDIRAIDDIRDALKPWGKVIMSIPCGKDELIWNKHRVYGKHRMSGFLSGWMVKQYVRENWRNGEETVFELTK